MSLTALVAVVGTCIAVLQIQSGVGLRRCWRLGTVFARSLTSRMRARVARSQPALDRSAVIGMFADVADEMGPPFARYCKSVLDAAFEGLVDEDPFIRQNSCVCVGNVLSNFPLLDRVPEALRALAPLFEGERDIGGVRDNATSALARMVRRLRLRWPGRRKN